MTRSEERLLQRLRQRKYRETEGLFLAEGERVVGDLIDAGVPLRFSVVAEDLELGGALATLHSVATVHRVDRATLDGFAPTQTPQGVLAVAEIPRASLAEQSPGNPATVLVLDAVQDPGNFGTLVRSAEALGAAFVAVLPGTVDPWNAKSVRAAAGSSFRIPIVSASAEEVVGWLHDQRFTLYGAAAEGESVEERALAERSALVVGNEGAGLSPTMRDAVDLELAVPMPGAAESLNVAVAAGILLYLLTRGSR